MATRRADFLSRDDLAVGDDWGDVFTLDGVDSFSAKPTTNDVSVRFAPPSVHGELDWRQDEIKLSNGVWNVIDNGDTGSFGNFQFKRATAGAAATISFRAFCKG